MTSRERIPTVLAAAAAAIFAVAAAVIAWAPPTRPPVRTPEVTAEPVWALTDPVTFSTDRWDQMFGGDSGVWDLTTADNPAASGLTAGDYRAAQRTAEMVWEAEVTGQQRHLFPGYWPDENGTRHGELPAGTRRCGPPTIHAAVPAAIPHDAAVPADYPDPEWVSVLLVWSAADCPGPLGETPTVTQLFLQRTPHETFTPIRPAHIPTTGTTGPAAALDPWLLEPVTGCAGPPIQLRLEPAWALSQLCRDATVAGITVTVTSGYRSIEEQHDRFTRAEAAYPNPHDWVAYADETSCNSKHCTGEAVDLAPNLAAIEWLTEPVGCTTPTGPTAGLPCPDGAAPITRIVSYGFIATAGPNNPWHLEYALPLHDTHPARCAQTVAGPVPQLIATIWECDLIAAGIGPDDIDQIVAEALVVARCASDWNPAATAFSGRWASTEHPDLGRTFNGVGVFQLTPEWVAAMMGPNSSPFNPATNITAAARLFLAEHAAGRDGWEPFGCAAGNDGTSPPMIPSRGGPELPDWTRTYIPSGPR